MKLKIGKIYYFVNQSKLSEFEVTKIEEQEGIDFYTTKTIKGKEVYPIFNELSIDEYRSMYPIYESKSEASKELLENLLRKQSILNDQIKVNLERISQCAKDIKE